MLFQKTNFPQNIVKLSNTASICSHW